MARKEASGNLHYDLPETLKSGKKENQGGPE
jgi:hypothetical protein